MDQAREPIANGGHIVRTRDKLAAELRKAGAMSRAHGVVYEAFALRAQTGEFDDYGEKYDCPITQLYSELIAAGLVKFAKRVANGEFDATKEESDEWARSAAGQAIAKELPPELRAILGMKLNN